MNTEVETNILFAPNGILKNSILLLGLILLTTILDSRSSIICYLYNNPVLILHLLLYSFVQGALLNFFLSKFMSLSRLEISITVLF